MDNLLKFFITIFTLFSLSPSFAVNINPDGQGEVLIFPYYTVNNDLNTLYQITNTTADPKAIKITFFEGEGGLEVLAFNVYLDAYDSWNAALTPGLSTFNNHDGEPTAIHLVSDNSCNPFLNGIPKEFVPYIIDTDFDANNKSMRRSTDGHIEVIEMGVVTNEDQNSAMALAHNNTGVPNDCQQLEDAWLGGGYWFANPDNDMAPPSGGLNGSAVILDTDNGHSYSFDAIALSDFWETDGFHSSPGSIYPNLYNSQTESLVIANGQTQTSTWIRGSEAISALLMQSNIFNEFDFDANNDGRTEWVVSFPTKAHHVNNVSNAIPPFSNLWDGLKSCDNFNLQMRDRNNREFNLTSIPPPTEGINHHLCYQVNVIAFLSDSNRFSNASQVLGSDNLISVAPANNNLNENNGWALINFDTNNQAMSPISGPGYVGLPAVGFKIQRVTNGNAQPGLLAQYGHVSVHKGRTFNTTEGNVNE